MKTVKLISLTIVFLLFTSALVPEIKRLDRQTPHEVEMPVIVEPYIEPYEITMNKNAIQQLNMQVRIILKEIEIVNQE